LIQLLGRHSTDPAVLQALTQHRIRRRPEVDLNDDGTVFNPRDFLLARRRGIEFGFEDQASFQGDDPDMQGKGPMLLTQLYFYGAQPDVHPYTIDSLPYRIRLDDDRHAVRQKLAHYEPARRSWVRDTWELPGHFLVVSYADDDARIGSILCALPEPPSATLDDVKPIPALDDLLGLLGRRMDDPELLRLARPLGFDNYLENRGTTVIALMRANFGLDMWFGGVRTMDATAFTNLYLYRDRYNEATAWQGDLPRGLEWNDSPEAVFQKLGKPSEPPNEEDFDGRALWHFDDYSLEAHYSTVYNWILSLRILAPGVWVAYLAS
jgi:hypothetical protein